MTEIIAVAVGAVLGYCAGWIQQRFDRRRRRVGLASAMLLELRRVERNLREIVASNRAAHASVEFPLAAHKRAMSELDLFEVGTVTAVFDLLSAVADVEHGMALFASGRVQRTEDRAWEQRVRATFAANRVAAAKRALLEDGGILGPERDLSSEATTYPELPPLNQPSFQQPVRPS